jgi:hypothetical protein
MARSSSQRPIRPSSRTDSRWTASCSLHERFKLVDSLLQGFDTPLCPAGASARHYMRTEANGRTWEITRRGLWGPAVEATDGQFRARTRAPPVSTGSTCAPPPMKSTSATVRLRQRVTKGPGSRTAGIAMAFKLIDSAQHRWRAVNSAHLVALVRAGTKFENGVLAERPDESTSGDTHAA